MIRSLHFKCIDLINDFITFFWNEHTKKLKSNILIRIILFLLVMLKKEYLCNKLLVDNINIVLRQEYFNLNDLLIYNKLTIYVKKILLKPTV